MSASLSRIRARAGVTLVEVMLAGALLALVCLTVMEALLSTARLVRDENGAVLVADGYALDAAWTILNGSGDAWPLNAIDAKSYVIPSNNVPALYAPGWAAPRVYLTVSNAAYQVGTLSAAGKMVSVNVVWGPAGRRRQLWGRLEAPCETGVATVYDRLHPREVFRAADIDRGESEVD